MPHVFLVVPVHNRLAYTKRFLSCIEQQSWTSLTTVVVDDGSTDGTAGFIEQSHPSVTLIRGDGNLWWTGAINVGIKWALERATPADHILVINDDVEVEPTFVERMVTFLQSRPRTLVGALAVPIGDDHIEDGGTVVNWWTAKHRGLNRGRRVSDFPAGHVEMPSYLTGRGVLIPVQAFRDAGLYDDEHFQQCGDTEFPVRAARHGYHLLVSYDCVVRSHVDAVAAVNRRRTYRPGMWREYFFGVRSNTRLKYRFFFARTGAGPNPVRLAVYLAFDLARISAHFLRGLSLS